MRFGQSSLIKIEADLRRCASSGSYSRYLLNEKYCYVRGIIMPPAHACLECLC
ncbi:MAG: hypothetical protein ACTSWN_04580 [Promethearchaeota archaeon]